MTTIMMWDRGGGWIHVVTVHSGVKYLCEINKSRFPVHLILICFCTQFVYAVIKLLLLINNKARLEESYRLWCVLVCNLETSRLRRLKTRKWVLNASRIIIINSKEINFALKEAMKAQRRRELYVLLFL